MSASTIVQKVRGVSEGFLLGAFASVCCSAIGGTVMSIVTSSNKAYVAGMTAGALAPVVCAAIVRNDFNQRSFGHAVLAGGLAVTAAIPFVMLHLLK